MNLMNELYVLCMPNFIILCSKTPPPDSAPKQSKIQKVWCCQTTLMLLTPSIRQVFIVHLSLLFEDKPQHVWPTQVWQCFLRTALICICFFFSGSEMSLIATAPPFPQIIILTLHHFCLCYLSCKLSAVSSTDSNELVNIELSRTIALN